MSEQALVVELGQMLKRAVDLSGQLAMEKMKRGDYPGAKMAMEWTQSMDSIASRVNHGNGTAIATASISAKRATPAKPTRFPYYFREPDELVKIGRSDKGDGTYRHTVPKDNFDEIMAVLVEFASTNVRFDTKDLQNRVHRIPRHQPLIVLDVLEEQRSILNTRRGQWAFVDRACFAVAAESVWENIPET
jgi:hypothetical protein